MTDRMNQHDMPPEVAHPEVAHIDALLARVGAADRAALSADALARIASATLPGAHVSSAPIRLHDARGSDESPASETLPDFTHRRTAFRSGSQRWWSPVRVAACIGVVGCLVVWWAATGVGARGGAPRPADLAMSTLGQSHVLATADLDAIDALFAQSDVAGLDNLWDDTESMGLRIGLTSLDDYTGETWTESSDATSTEGVM